jgi:hypothetical protein
MLKRTGLMAFLIVTAAAPFAEQSRPAEYPIRPVPLDQVQITGGFWRPRLETNRTITIPHILQQNETTGRVDNLRRGAKKLAGEYQGRRFNDTDVYKVIEAAAYTLVSHPDPALSKKLDDLIDLIAASQQPDGYVFPARTINPARPAAGVGTERFIHENTGSHELYNFGHLYEAAIAHAAATRKRTLMDVAIRNANLVRRTFGPGARRDAPGHQEIELALVRLYQATNDRRYLDLAKFFLDERGKPHASKDYPADSNFAIYNDRPYRQDHRPVTEQPRAVGHAVRATYLYAAMTDIAGMLGNRAYDDAVNRLWQDVVDKRLYITGGMGARGTVEAFGDDYELPNRTAYTETCASVGGLLWHHRMFLKSGDAKYLDAFEQTLYNGYLSGVSVKGDTFFYQNPLESIGRAERSAYFDVACCPANLARLMARLPELVYAQREDELFVNLYAETKATVKLTTGQVQIDQTTRYPWDGKVSLALQMATPMEFTLRLRAPGWLEDAPIASGLYRFTKRTDDEPVTVLVAGRRAEAQIDRGWITLRRQWMSGDRVELTIPMPVRRVLSHDAVKDNIGKAALQRGPIVYSLEGVDNGGRVVDAVVPLTSPFTPVFQGELMGGVMVLRADLREAALPMAATRVYTAVPYFAWANRGRGEMVVWIRY